ncbi:MAG: undecaprenyl-diphosphate phosphatase [Candidatus Cloacimonadales bacterium]
MQILKSIIMGIIQGLTEFLPVSSSGHLVLAKHYLGIQFSSSVAFEVFLHLGSVLAVLIYYRKDIAQLLISLFKFKDNSKEHLHNRNTIYYLLVATFVTGLIYFFFDDRIEAIFDTTNPNNLYWVSIFLAITGLIVFCSDKISVTQLNQRLGIKKSILIGIAQAFALLPGISRSGSTISMGIFVGMKREEAARFSFLLSLPAILGANIMKFGELSQLNSSDLSAFLFGALAAFISGLLVISALIKLIKDKKLKYFAYYCWIIATISIIFYTVS